MVFMTLLIYSGYTKRHFSQPFDFKDLHKQSLLNDLKIGIKQQGHL